MSSLTQDVRPSPTSRRVPSLDTSRAKNLALAVLAATGFLLLGGRLADLLGRRRMFMQDVLHYSPIKTGVCYLPLGVGLFISAGSRPSSSRASGSS